MVARSNTTGPPTADGGTRHAHPLRESACAREC
jgi:hypothetical protein